MGTDKHEQRKRRTAQRYERALALYRDTDWPAARICGLTDTSAPAFRAYLRRYHRNLLYVRHGRATTADDTSPRLRDVSGQTPAAAEKYRAAIDECRDLNHVADSVSEIARRHGLNPTGLGNQLRRHYPEIVEERNRARSRLAIRENNAPRGAKPQCREAYATAVAHLRATEDTIAATARHYGLSAGGLREHLRYYHNDIVASRAARRLAAKGNSEVGALSGNGSRHRPKMATVEKYAQGVELYRMTGLSVREIAVRTGVEECALRKYLRKWHPGIRRRK